MSRSRKALTQVEIFKILEELSDDDSIDDAIRDNIHVSVIPPDPDEMADEDDFDENNIDDNENENDFAGVYEVEGEKMRSGTKFQ